MGVNDGKGELRIQTNLGNVAEIDDTVDVTVDDDSAPRVF